MYLCLRVSISSKTGNKYVCLGLDLGYRFLPLFFKDSEIAEVLGLSVPEYVSSYRSHLLRDDYPCPTTEKLFELKPVKV